jgi:S-disulfanyl-L-cysteine oxidoreductase SoxD
MKLVVFVIALAMAPAFAEEDAAPRTTQDGVYTADQAERGKEGYQQACAGCHPLDYYQGPAMKAWDGAPLFNLYDVVATTMPQNNPGSLKRREYLDLIAYILSLNDMPLGNEELPATPEALKKIVIKWRTKP